METELERLSKMVGVQDAEPIDTASLIEDGLKMGLANLGKIVSPDRIREMEDEIRNSGNTVETPHLRKVATANVRGNNVPDIVSNASMEKVLVSLYDTREGLVQAFETCNINSKTASLLTKQINRVSSCIRYMGGEIEEFEPMNHISGLSVPNFYKNAQKVIETTMQCYSLGEVSNAKVLEDGRKITISFSGTSGNVSYKANGEVTSEEWTGNEAIDYIYTPNSGQMSVKAFENGRWIDRRASGKYKIVWELEENDVEVVEVVEPEVTKQGRSHSLNDINKNLTDKKEKVEIMPNNTPEDNDLDLSSPIK